MHIRQPVARAVENPVPNASHCTRRAGWIGRETPVLRLQSDYAIHTRGNLQHRATKAKTPKRLISSSVPKTYPALMKWILAWLLVSARLIAGTLTVATYNLEFYVDAPALGTPPKSVEGRSLIRESIRRMNPDLLALQEVGSTNALVELVTSLRAEKMDFPFAEYVKGPDTNLHLAFLS